MSSNTRTKPLSLFEILDNNKRIIIYSDEVRGDIYTWDFDIHFEAWTQETSQRGEGQDRLFVLDAERFLPRCTKPFTVNKAIDMVMQWIAVRFQCLAV